MKVSIIIPIYNVEDYLEECIESSINQSLNNIEIICINDGSTDGSEGILNRYKEKYKNIKVINQENKGLSAARNVGTREATGEYIYFLDSDDYIDTKAMEVCYKEAKKYDLDIITFDATCFYDDGYNGKEISENYDRSRYMQSRVMSGKEFYTISNRFGCYKAPVWLNFYKTSFIKNNNMIFEEGILHEDEIYTCKSFLKATKVKYIPFKFFKRRFRNNSIMTNTISKGNIEGYLCASKYTYKLYCEYVENHEIELAEILKCNTRKFLNLAITYSDMLGLYDLRKNIIDFVHNKNNIVDENLDMQINSPSLFYNKHNIKNDRNKELYSYKHTKKIFYMLVPTHGNLGDQGIVYSSLKYLEDKYPHHKIIKINFDETYLYGDIIKNISNSDDFVVLHGGGNMGNHYIWEEQARRHLISILTNIPIISFTQTIYFSDDEAGRKEFEISKDIYNNHNNLTLIAREQTSFEIMKENFYNCNVLLCPDIVFYLNNKLNREGQLTKREYITTFFREDKETYYSLENKFYIVEKIKEKHKVLQSDTTVNYKVNGINREEELHKLWQLYYKSKVIITDRLHGMVFAAITNTPCIVLRSIDYKVTESFKWIKDLNYIRFVDSLDVKNIKQIIKELENIKTQDKYDFGGTYFSDVKKHIDRSLNQVVNSVKTNDNPRIDIKTISVNDNKIKCEFDVDNRIKKYFNYTSMTLEYSELINDTPDSVAVIPTLSNILPIAWFTNSDIYVDELDEVFYNSVKNIKKAYENMYDIKLGGNLIAKKLVSNSYECKEKYISLFSGGVDSLSTVIENINKSPVLATIWGSDIDCSNESGWLNIKDAVEDMGKKFNLKNVFIKSDFRKCINEIQLNVISRNMVNCQFWWESIQHGIALISHLAPYAYQNKMKTIFIPGTLCKEYIDKYGKSKLASDPTIDDEFKFASCNTVHDGFEYSRQDKIDIISTFSEKVDFDFETRVCFSSNDGKNCSKCKKCSITILGLIQQKKDPNKFGFNVDDKLMKEMKYRYENEFVFAPFALDWWRNIKNKFVEDDHNWIENTRVNWIMDIDTSDEFNMSKAL